MKSEAAVVAPAVDKQQIADAEEKRARLQESLWSLEKQVRDGLLLTPCQSHCKHNSTQL